MIAHHFPDDNYTFMDDNGPIHRACTVYQYKENNTIHHTDWPAQSPDINPIKNVWLKFKIGIEPKAVNIHTQNDLLAAVRLSWENNLLAAVRLSWENNLLAAVHLGWENNLLAVVHLSWENNLLAAVHLSWENKQLVSCCAP